MEVILLFVVGFIIFLIAIFSVIKMIANRVTAPTKELQDKVSHLSKRVKELENEE